MVLKEILTHELTKRAVEKHQLMWETWNNRRKKFEEENPGLTYPEDPPQVAENKL